jgi:hypothetical protein
MSPPPSPMRLFWCLPCPILANSLVIATSFRHLCDIALTLKGYRYDLGCRKH